MKYPVSNDAIFILRRLNSLGYEAHIVGGSVRDLILGKTPSDYDMTTSATPEKIKSAFSDMKTVDTGIKHGTVTVIYNGNPYEITTHRTESGYTDNRHPDGVSFTASLTDDLARRDFTVNAMCLDANLVLTDVFGGVHDAKAGIIRAVGNPKTRFCEDALRIMRAMRFAATLGFEIEEETAKAILECKELLSNISGERIYTELCKLISGTKSYEILKKFSSVLSDIIPSISVMLPRSEQRFLEAEPTVRLISLFAPSRSPVSELLVFAERMHTDTHFKRLASAVLGNLSRKAESAPELRHLLSELGDEAVGCLFKVKYLVYGEDKRELFDFVTSSEIPYKVSQLAVGGDELKALGITGCDIGKCLSMLLLAVMNEELPNDKDALLKYIKRSV